jgi:vacuolar-type H+-ATPase subunit E/Vma4
MDEVLNRARKKVADALSENDARQKMILTMIGEALAEIEDENVKIGISKTTAEAVNFARLKSEASKLSKGKLDWRVSEEVDPDGVVVESTDAKRRVLNTISSRFERLDSQILTQVKQRLFAETR